MAGFVANTAESLWTEWKQYPRTAAGLAGALALVVGFAGWTLLERSARTQAEREGAALHEQLDAQNRELARLSENTRAQTGALTKTAREKETIAGALTQETLNHRATADRLIGEKGALDSRVGELNAQVETLERRVKNLSEDLQAAVTGSRTLEENLAAERAVATGEREAAEAAFQNARREADKARTDTKKTAEALRKTEQEAKAEQERLLKGLQRTNATLDAAAREGQQLSNDLSRALRDREVALATARDMQLALNNALHGLNARDQEAAALKLQTATLLRSNQQLTQQINVLNAEIARLKKLLPP